jgi:hypothetical protein
MVPVIGHIEMGLWPRLIITKACNSLMSRAEECHFRYPKFYVPTGAFRRILRAYGVRPHVCTCSVPAAPGVITCSLRPKVSAGTCDAFLYRQKRKVKVPRCRGAEKRQAFDPPLRVVPRQVGRDKETA